MKSQHDYVMEFKQCCKDNPTRRVTFYGWMILMEYAPQAEKSTLVKVADYTPVAYAESEGKE